MKKTILSIDGGGIRGIIPLKVLEYIEQQTGKQIHELFDVIGGTSTGGIIALGLTCNIPDTTQVYKAKELLRFYTDQKYVQRIFKRNPFIKLETFQEEADGGNSLEKPLKVGSLQDLAGLWEPRYEAESVEIFFQEKFHSKMSELKTKGRVIVCSYDIKNDCPYYFRNEKIFKTNKDNYSVWQAARATSAAPTFFPAAQFPSDSESRMFIDGGVYINNPALQILIEASSFYPDENNFLLISLGTGNLKITHSQLENAGAYGWMLNILHPGALLEVMMNGVSEATHKQLKILSQNNENNSVFTGVKIPILSEYKRYQIELPENIAMDDIKTTTIEKLIKLGESLVTKKKSYLDKLCNTLLKL
ncbi:MAG: patatin-like phospholipase family protein [Planktothrix sp.]